MIWLQTTCSDLPFYLVPLSFFPFCSLASEGSLWILTQAVFFVCLFLRLVTHSCLTLCNLMNCSPPGSSVHGILQARILEWVAPSPGDLPHPGTELTSLMSPVLAGRFITTSATWEALVINLWVFMHEICFFRLRSPKSFWSNRISFEKMTLKILLLKMTVSLPIRHY